MKKIALLIMIVSTLIISGCNSGKRINPTPTKAMLPTVAVQNPKPTEQLAVEEARGFVISFLGILQGDMKSKDAAQFLAPELNKQIKDGDYSILFSSSAPLSSFEVSAGILSPDGLSYTFDATLNFDKPNNFRIEVIKVEGAWKINVIGPREGESAYPRLPEEVVQSFLTAYQESPTKMLMYLSPKLKNKLPSSGPVGLLQITGVMEGSMIQSASVSQDPPFAVIKVVIRAGGKESMKIFSLNLDNGKWLIDNVETAK